MIRIIAGIDIHKKVLIAVVATGGGEGSERRHRAADRVGRPSVWQRDAGAGTPCGSPKGNRSLRRIFTQAAQAAVKTKGMPLSKLVPQADHQTSDAMAPSGRLPTGCAGWSGRSCTMASATSNKRRRRLRRARNGAPKGLLRRCANSAIRPPLHP